MPSKQGPRSHKHDDAKARNNGEDKYIALDCVPKSKSGKLRFYSLFAMKFFIAHKNKNPPDS